MKRFCLTLAMALAMAGICGCDEDEEPGSEAGADFYSGTWNGTMTATQLMGQPALESDIVPITLIITVTDDSIRDEIFLSIVFQANGMPGIFTGTANGKDGTIVFAARADYDYVFRGTIDYSARTMAGTWTVNIPGGMSGTWQAGR